MNLHELRCSAPQEHGAHVITTAPTVPFEVTVHNELPRLLENPVEWPLGQKVMSMREPTVVATILTPTEHVGAVMQLCIARRGEMQDHTILGALREGPVQYVDWIVCNF